MSATTLDRPSVETGPQWSSVATEDQIQTTIAALTERGFVVQVVDDAAAARDAVLGLIPDGSEVHQASSVTLDAIGVTEAINTSGHFNAVRPRMFAMDRATQGAEIRKLASAPAYMVGSVHAITEAGSLVVASKTGSQLGPYAFGAGKVILVAGTNKIVSDLDEAFQRIDEHSLPLESARAKAAYGMGSSVDKVLVIHSEFVPNRTTVILIRESLGF
jgi:LUD domain